MFHELLVWSDTCGNDTSALGMRPADGSMEIADITLADEQKYLLYPNPTDGNISITTLEQLVRDTEPVQAEIWNSVGERVYQDRLKFESSKKGLIVQNATPGLYLLQLKDSKGSVFILKL